jgi:hypothetical protein
MKKNGLRGLYGGTRGLLERSIRFYGSVSFVAVPYRLCGKCGHEVR